MIRISKLLLLLFALVSVARADEWSKTFTITGKPALRVETSDANIRVDTWDQNTIEARVTSEHWKIGEGGVRVIERQSGDSVELEVRLPHEHHICIVCVNIRSYRVNVEIHMPREGHVNLHTGDGSIKLSNFKGDMDLESSDGSQEIESVDGTLRAHAGDGHIRAAGRFDSLQVSTGDGRIETRALAGSAMGSGWDLHAGDGSVTLELPENFAADVDLHTGDGHISLDMPVTVEGRLGGNNIHGKLNGGGNLLTIHTGDGSIRLQKS
ncbi:MAG TPA: DUF4097 family beta strand repeat-containing protein [Terriglobales bacterium]|nr:DUF4097 family beta strand repeat-containing protein [Terriglobales bacterium]